ncbi:MAG TPA: flagellar hook-length control protein FliK [Bosea sp. (in: a-proteobacteria)]
MNLATLVHSQTLATLLQALAPASGLVPGKTVEARLLALAGDGTATAQIGSETIALVLAGPAAKQAALQPGATLVLKLDAPYTPEAGLKATLVEVRPPTAAVTQPASPPAQAATTTAAAQPVTTAATTAAAPASQQAAGKATTTLPPAPSHAGASQSSSAPQPATLRVGTAAPGVTAPAEAAPAPLVAQAASPRALAGPMLGPALARQDSLAPLLANMRALADGSVAVALPKPLLTLVDRVLGQAIPVERKTVTALVLKTAVQNSGLFLESHQAEGRPLPPGGDLKANLQALRASLAPLLEALSLPQATRAEATGKAPADANLLQPPPEQAARPSPPRRDGALIPQPIAEASLSAGDKPLAIVETLLEQTDAALDRIKLAQYASLPPEGPRTEVQASQRWLTELPLAFHNGAAMLPLQIEKEPPRRDADGAAGPLWRVRFALDVEPMGPLQGVVTLQGRSVGITLWAEREETSRLLRGASPGLQAALADAQFENGTIDIHTGQPRVTQPTAGQFLDRMS